VVEDVHKLCVEDLLEEDDACAGTIDSFCCRMRGGRGGGVGICVIIWAAEEYELGDEVD